jgi:hypothetical protein
VSFSLPEVTVLSDQVPLALIATVPVTVREPVVGTCSQLPYGFRLSSPLTLKHDDATCQAPTTSPPQADVAEHAPPCALLAELPAVAALEPPLLALPAELPLEPPLALSPADSQAAQTIVPNSIVTSHAADCVFISRTPLSATCHQCSETSDRR